MLKATPSRIPLNKLKTKNRKNKFKSLWEKKKTDIVKPPDIQKFQLQLALKIVRLKDLKCLPYSLNSVDLLM